MPKPKRGAPIARTHARTQRFLEVAAFLAALALTAWSAVIVKSRTTPAAPLAAVERVSFVRPSPQDAVLAPLATALASPAPARPAAAAIAPIEVETPPADASVRWFDGQAMRPARVIWMTVTAYSPDHRSCGIWADGKTATLRSVWTNGMRLVAADPRVLPMHSLVSVPGYADGEIVPVLDKGGAIKGARLDVLFPTHERARQWGVQRIPVTIWEPAD